jgi:hypothetical protein
MLIIFKSIIIKLFLNHHYVSKVHSLDYCNGSIDAKPIPKLL